MEIGAIVQVIDDSRVFRIVGISDDGSKTLEPLENPSADDLKNSYACFMSMLRAIERENGKV